MEKSLLQLKVHLMNSIAIKLNMESLWSILVYTERSFEPSPGISVLCWFPEDNMIRTTMYEWEV